MTVNFRKVEELKTKRTKLSCVVCYCILVAKCDTQLIKSIVHVVWKVINLMNQTSSTVFHEFQINDSISWSRPNDFPKWFSTFHFTLRTLFHFEDIEHNFSILNRAMCSLLSKFCCHINTLIKLHSLWRNKIFIGIPMPFMKTINSFFFS